MLDNEQSFGRDEFRRDIKAGFFCQFSTCGILRGFVALDFPAGELPVASEVRPCWSTGNQHLWPIRSGSPDRGEPDLMELWLHSEIPA